MQRILPSGFNIDQFDKALHSFATVVGKEWVMDSDIDRDAYVDAYAFGNTENHAPSAAVAPASVEELQAIMRLANEHKIPLWPISRGKNYGYGGAAPRMPGTIVLDLDRMRRILDVNVERGYCVVEPGVSFFDLYHYFTENDIPLWSPMPGNCVGSVLGNALEHGTAYGPHGDRASNICGMEVVLPNGELVRTGHGAMSNSDCWHLFKHGYGPSWDQMFMQSNFGVVTKMGCWMMPEPEATIELSMEVPDEEDIGWIVEALAPLRMNGVIPGLVNIGNFMRYIMGSSQQHEWYQGDGAIPENILADIRKERKLGWWGLNIMLYGHPETLAANSNIIKRVFAKYTDQKFEIKHWASGEPRPPYPPYGVPISFPLRIANWISPNGGHLSFSPVLPPEKNAVLDQLRRSRQMFRDYGFDFYGAFTLGERHINVVNMLAYDQNDADMTQRARDLFIALMKDAERRGYGEYRSHLAFMDDVAATYDFNNFALRRLNETLKDAVDPNGILAPGKQGIWPAKYRKESSS